MTAPLVLGAQVDEKRSVWHLTMSVFRIEARRNPLLRLGEEIVH